MDRIVFQRALTSLIAGLLVFGTCGYVLIEGWSLFDGLYMTIITLSTVGYGETRDLTPPGRLFTTILISISVLSMAGWTAATTSLLVSGDLNRALRRRKERRMISKMSKHTIVCGGGTIAQTIIGQLVREQKDVVVITNVAEQIDQIRRMFPSVPIVEDEPKSELAMGDANALKAGYLVAATDTDYDNLLITITGSGLGTGISIISCVHKTEMASRMMKVGADEVVCPLILCGQAVAQKVA